MGPRAFPAGRSGVLAALLALASALWACSDGGGSSSGDSGGGTPPPPPPPAGRPVSVTFTQIMVAYTTPKLPHVKRTKAEARALAEALTKRVRAGEPMEPLVLEHTDDRDEAGKPFNDGSYSKTWDQIPHVELRRAVFSLKIGETAAEPVDSGAGFHVLRRDG